MVYIRGTICTFVLSDVFHIIFYFWQKNHKFLCKISLYCLKQMELGLYNPQEHLYSIRHFLTDPNDTLEAVMDLYMVFWQHEILINEKYLECVTLDKPNF